MEQTHIIHKVVIEVSVNNRKKANEIKDDISSFLAMDIFPQLEKYLDTAQAQIPAHTVQIPRLVLDFNQSESSLNTELKNNIITSFRKELTEIIKTGSSRDNSTKEHFEISLLGKEEKLLLSFIHFLKTGAMPWWNSKEESAIIFEPASFKKIVSEKAFAAKVVHSMQKPEVRERIINQFTDAQIEQICFAVIKARGLKIALKNPVIKQLSRQSFSSRKAIWSLILNVLSVSFGNDADNPQKYIVQQIRETISLLKAVKGQDSQQQVWAAITAIFPSIKQSDTDITAESNSNNTRNKATEKRTGNAIGNRENEFLKAAGTQSLPEMAEADLRKDQITGESSGYQLQNAGLVLIHPFISNLFKHCNLIDPETKKLIDPETGVHLLHYIATGKTNQPESNMLFEKFLCNIPLDQTINRHVKLSRWHKSEAAKVIGAVQQNWGAMKTASIGLLQHEFLQRPGKLVPDSQILTIERKAQDILLDKLSWGIGMIKLPWQNEFIFVNW